MVSWAVLEGVETAVSRDCSKSHCRFHYLRRILQLLHFTSYWWKLRGLWICTLLLSILYCLLRWKAVSDVFCFGFNTSVGLFFVKTQLSRRGARQQGAAVWWGCCQGPRSCCKGSGLSWRQVVVMQHLHGAGTAHLSKNFLSPRWISWTGIMCRPGALPVQLSQVWPRI